MTEQIDSKALSVNLVQMRGDKMVEIVSVQKENAGQLDVSGAFDLKEGDTVQVVLTKSLDGKKGSAAQILEDSSCGQPENHIGRCLSERRKADGEDYRKNERDRVDIRQGDRRERRDQVLYRNGNRRGR